VLFDAIVTAAGPVAKYSKQALEQAQDAGKPVIVFVTASWCPNCRAQQPIVDTLTKDPAFSEAVLFVVDFDSDKQALRDLKRDDAVHPDRLQGKTERKRSTAVHRPRADPHPVPERALIRWAWAPAPSGFAAGVLTAFSPCVLPLLAVTVTTAFSVTATVPSPWPPASRSRRPCWGWSSRWSAWRSIAISSD